MEKFGRICKQRMVEEFIKKLDNYPNVFIIGYDGSPSEAMQTLRRNLRSTSSMCFVIKNRLTKIALEKKNLGQLCKFIKGMSAFIFTKDDPILTSKVLVSSSKELGSLKVFAGFLEGRIYSDSEIGELSALPPREALLTRALICINSPLNRLANSLNAILKKLLLTLKEISGKKVGP